MATFRKRGDRWQAQVRRRGHAPVTRSFLTKFDAETWARQTEASLERSALPVDLRRLDRTSFRELLTRYQLEVTPTKRGAFYESYRINQLLKHDMAMLPLSRLSGAVFASYRDERLRMVSGETVRREMTILRHVIEVARREWDYPFTVNPVADVKRPKPGRPRERRLAPSDLGKLLVAVSRSRSRYLKPALLLALETGLRRGELLAMRWAHIDWERCVLAVPTTKTGEPRTIPLTPNAIEHLSSLRRTAADKAEYVLPITANALRRAWERLCKRAMIADLHWHDLRHEAISRFFELGLSLPEVALISGHKEPRMLMRYTHLRPDALAQKLAGMALNSPAALAA